MNSLRLKIEIHKLILPVLKSLRPIATWVLKKSYYFDTYRLNRELFSNVSSIPPQEMESTNKLIHEYCRLSNLNPAYGINHGPRLILSKNWLQTVLPTEGHFTALDLGAEGISTFLWKQWFPNIQWENTNFDLRFRWDLPDTFVDFIVCTEVIEHLPDQPNAIYNEGFGKFGVRSLLQESFRVLKPGGVIFITTPNAASMLHLRAALLKIPPWFFDMHIREYTLEEVTTEVKKAGFEVFRAQDVHCMSTTLYPDFISLFELLQLNGYSTERRGDDLFILARKPV